MSLDNTDKRIIDILQKDASLPYREIADKLGMNESTVRKRVVSLKRRNIVKIIALVEPEQLGMQEVLLGLEVEPARIIDVGKELARMKDVRMVFSSSGDYDFCIVVWISDRESLTKLVNIISTMEGVTKVSPSMVLEKLKGPPPSP